MNLKALHTLSCGMYVICSRSGDRLNGQIANTVIQVCSDPPVISVCINKKNLTHEFIRNSGFFTVSVLSEETPLNFIGTFGFKSGRDTDKFAGINYRPGESGAPVVLDHTLAWMEARVINQADTITHTIFIGQLTGAEVVKEGAPMTYAYYQQVKRGTTPKTAPSYMEEKKQEEIKPVHHEKYKCNVCGYIYDPEKGDPDNGVAPGTPFSKLPDSWVCPVCGASKDEFEKV